MLVTQDIYLIVLLQKKSILSPNLTTFLYRNPGFFLTKSLKDFRLLKSLLVLALDFFLKYLELKSDNYLDIVPFL